MEPSREGFFYDICILQEFLLYFICIFYFIFSSMVDFLIAMLRKLKWSSVENFLWLVYLLPIIWWYLRVILEFVSMIFSSRRGFSDIFYDFQSWFFFVFVVIFFVLLWVFVIRLLRRSWLKIIIDVVHLILLPLFLIAILILRQDLIWWPLGLDLPVMRVFAVVTLLYPFSLLIRWIFIWRLWDIENNRILKYILRFQTMLAALMIPIWAIVIINVFSDWYLIPLLIWLPTIIITFIRHFIRNTSYNWILGWWIMFLIASFLQFLQVAREEVPEMIVDRALERTQKAWHNYESHKNMNYGLLSRSYLSFLKDDRYMDTTHFQKIFDATPELYYGDKLSKHRWEGSTRSNATNATKVWNAADVVLKLAEIQNYITSDGNSFPLLESKYSFHLTNTTDTNQEVVIYFEAPSKYSVVSDLVLWLNGEMQWQVAPRGAAKKVYADALRRNIDPALIEKLWTNTYSLRVFPIPRSSDSKTQWRQLVTLSILTPIFEDEESVSYTPKFSFINMKYNKDSNLLSKVFTNNELVIEDIVKNKDIEKYLSSSHEISRSNANIPDSTTSLFDYCVPPDIVASVGGYPRLQSLVNGYNKSYDVKKTSIFFDNSMSTKRNNVRHYYADIYDEIKNYGDTLHDMDIYSYNFMVERLADIKDLKQRWYSDLKSVLDYIEDNNIQDERIIIVTDDDSYNFSTVENKNRDLEILLSNQIFVFKIWWWIRRFTSDFNNLLTAARWDVFNISDDISRENAIQKIYEPSFPNIQITEDCESLGDDSQKISKVMWWYISTLLLWLISDNNHRSSVAELQTKIAQAFPIVNQFNAMIALETQDQQRDLERYSNQWDKYDSSLDNLESQNSLGSKRQWFANDFAAPIGAQWNSNAFLSSNPYINQNDAGTSEDIQIIWAASVQADRRRGSFISWLVSTSAWNSDGAAIWWWGNKSYKAFDFEMNLSVKELLFKWYIWIIIFIQRICICSYLASKLWKRETELDEE